MLATSILCACFAVLTTISLLTCKNSGKTCDDKPGIQHQHKNRKLTISMISTDSMRMETAKRKKAHLERMKQQNDAEGTGNETGTWDEVESAGKGTTTGGATTGTTAGTLTTCARSTTGGTTATASDSTETMDNAKVSPMGALKKTKEEKSKNSEENPFVAG
ncbi:hypothetical protein L596_017781 [Steinernema carpocapsae]|uniref:Uncharacterized protein n=1 Tax=Steinernema carpocapsae TaxID=34508 RepID=A0A4U5N3G3_STECR|nr:hypothetical protein L596_017781 [Steinernema carpocapsae]